MKKINQNLTVCILFLSFISCNDERPNLGEAPTTKDAEFAYNFNDSNQNIVEFLAGDANYQYVWDFGNGRKSAEKQTTSFYPNKGDYDVSLTVFGPGGSASTKQTIQIVNDDLSLLSDSIYYYLTGGSERTWMIDSTRDQHLGVGPNPPDPTLGFTPNWWAAGPADKSGCNLYDDRFTFRFEGFEFDQITNGFAYTHGDFHETFPSSVQVKDDYTVPFENQMGETWTIDKESDTTISISGKAFIGFYTGQGTNTYKVLKINNNEMHLRYLHEGNEELSWYLWLVPVE